MSNAKPESDTPKRGHESMWGSGLVWNSCLGLQLGAKTGNESEKNCSKMFQRAGVRGWGSLPALQNDGWNGMAGMVEGWG